MKRDTLKYTVLTYIFDDYEFVREPYASDDNAEYILVTDNPELESAVWKIVYDKRLEGLSTFDKCYWVRFHPFEYASTEICLRLDASIQIKSSLRPIVEKFQEQEADIMLMMNPVHNHLHDDYKMWVETRGYPQAAACRALQKLESLGYDPDYKGYYQACLVIERNNRKTQGIDLTTYDILKELGVDGRIDRLDQPIWSFVMNKYYSDSLSVMAVDESIVTFSKYMQWCLHNKSDMKPFQVRIKPQYLFNRLVKCEDFSYFQEIGYFKPKMRYFKRKYVNPFCHYLKNIARSHEFIV